MVPEDKRIDQNPNDKTTDEQQSKKVIHDHIPTISFPVELNKFSFNGLSINFVPVKVSSFSVSYHHFTT